MFGQGTAEWDCCKTRRLCCDAGYKAIKMTEYTNQNLHKRAAAYYRSARSQAEPQNINDLETHICEFEHLIMANDFEAASNLLLEIDDQYLALWGFYDRVIMMRSKLTNNLPDDRLEIDNEIAIANIFRQIGGMNEAISHGEKALSIAYQVGDKARECKALSVLGGIYRRVGNAELAIDCSRKAIELSRQLQDHDVELQSSLQLSHVLNYIGRTEEAAQVLREAITVAFRVGNKKMQGDLKGQLGYTELWLGNTKAAIQNFMSALQVAQAIGNKRGQGYWYLALGESYMVDKNYISAQRNFASSIKIAEEIQDTHLLSYAKSFLAQTLLYSGDLFEARVYIVEARNIDNPQHNDFKAMLHGLLLSRIGETTLAFEVLNEALKISNELLEKAPDLLEAKCNKGVTLLTLAIISKLNNKSLTQVLEARDVFVQAFSNSVAEGVIARYTELIAELRPLDMNSLVELATKYTNVSIKNALDLTGAFIELHVEDLDLAIEFYKKLGFIVALRITEGDNYLTMRRNTTIINFYGYQTSEYSHPYFSKYPRETQRGYGVEIIIPVDNIEKEYEMAVSVINASFIVERLAIRPWGKRDFRIVDPFGFYIRFTERINWLKP